MSNLKSVLKKEEYLITNTKRMENEYINFNKKNIDKLKKNPQDFLSKLSCINLVNLIQKLNYSYYIDGVSVISDDLYDYVKEVLRKIDSENAILNDIGVSKVYKTKLPYHMGSMDKINSDEKSLKNWLKKYNKNGYVISDKLDGISGLFIKNDDGECKLFTRGDGSTGKDISYLINFIKGLKGLSNSIAIRGELIISKNNFNKIKIEGKVMNTRNVVAGIINSKKPNLEIAKLIKFVSYELIFPSNLTAKEQFDYLQSNNYSTAFNRFYESINIGLLSNLLEERRINSKYDIDGIIVTDNNNHNRITDGNPKYSFAFKNIQTLNKAEVMVLEVEWNITKDRYIQPVVLFDGIEIDGVIVKRATGKNAKFIKDNNIGAGSKILIVRRGDVIPHIEEVLTCSEVGTAQMPNYAYEWNETGVEILLPVNNDLINEDLIKETNIKNMENFITKMEFKGISIGIVSQLYESGIDSISKFINLRKEDLLNIEGIKEKKANNILDSIEETLKNIDCIKLMTASNSFGRGFGKKKLKLIMDNIEDKNFIKKPTLRELISIKGIEEKTAHKFINNIDNYLKFIEDIKINKEFNYECNKENDKFNNLNIVFTGIRDKELEKEIENGGGSIKSSITKCVNYLIVKDNNIRSSKVLRANELNIEVISLKDFKLKFN